MLISYTVIPIDSCLTGPFSVAVTWIVSLSAPVNSWIFFMRVRAAYYESRVIVGSFAVLWACTLLYIGTPFAYVVTIIPLGAGKCAMSTKLNHTLEAAGFLLVAIFDTAVMIAISIRVMSYSLSQTWKIEAILTRVWQRNGRHFENVPSVHSNILSVMFIPGQ